MNSPPAILGSDFMIVLSRKNFDSIVSHARKILPNEDCGLLGGIVDGEKKIVEKIYFLTNLDASPEHFSMDAKEQFAAVKNMRENNLKLLGNFHSHPTSPSRPSEEDKRLVFDTKLSYLILSLAEENPILKSFTFDKEKNVSEEKILIE